MALEITAGSGTKLVSDVVGSGDDAEHLVHHRDPDRDALIDALALLGSQATAAAILAKMPTSPATEATLAAIGTLLAGGIDVAGPLTSAQLATAALMTDAKGEAIRALLAAGIGVTGPLTAAQLTTAALMTDAKGEEIRALLARTLTAVSTAIPTVSVATYATGRLIGSKLTFPNLARTAGGAGMVQMAAIQSKSLQNFPCELWLFHTDPAATTFTDNTAFDLNATDFDKVLGVVPISTWYPAGPTRSFAQATQLAMAYKIAGGQTDGFGALVSRSAPALASTSDLKVVVKALVD